MPTYGYRCDSCGNEFDLKQSFSAEPEQQCPVCSNTARRRFYAPPVIYKGSGFYTTDYARKSGSSSSSADSNGSSSSSGESPSSDSGKSSDSSKSSDSGKSSADSSSSSSTASTTSSD